MKILLHCNTYIHPWTRLSWRGKSKLPNEHPLEHCVKQQASLGTFPLFLYSTLWQNQFHGKFHVSRSGVRTPVEAILCDVTPMTTHINQSINQSIKFFKKYSPLIDRCRKLGEGKKAKKIPVTGIRTPDLETWNSMVNDNTRSTCSQTTL